MIKKHLFIIDNSISTDEDQLTNNTQKDIMSVSFVRDESLSKLKPSTCSMKNSIFDHDKQKRSELISVEPNELCRVGQNRFSTGNRKPNSNASMVEKYKLATNIEKNSGHQSNSNQKHNTNCSSFALASHHLENNQETNLTIVYEKF